MHVECTKRERRMSILLSDEEQLIVDRYLEKYKITNKSRWLRETILMFIHKNMEEDYPTKKGGIIFFHILMDKHENRFTKPT